MPNDSPLPAVPARPLSLLLLGLALLGAGVVHEVFPLSTFDGKAVPPPSVASRLMARDRRGALVEIEALDRWSCGAPLSLAAPTPSGEWSSVEADARALRWIARHGATDPTTLEPYELVRRRFRLPGAPVPSADGQGTVPSTNAAPVALVDRFVARCLASAK